MIVAKRGTIEAARAALGLTQKQFAEVCGISAARVCHIEKHGASITPKTAKKICDSTQKQFGELFETVQKDDQ